VSPSPYGSVVPGHLLSVGGGAATVGAATDAPPTAIGIDDALDAEADAAIAHRIVTGAARTEGARDRAFSEHGAALLAIFLTMARLRALDAAAAARIAIR